MEASLRSADGLCLQLREWPCAVARGSVLIVHGLGEHSGRHARLAAQLNAWGWRVVGYDQRGHGSSEGARGSLTRDDDLLRDLARVVDKLRAAHPGPLVLLGHSMGGLVAARLVAGGLVAPVPPWSRGVDALVLSSPALATETSPAQKLLLALAGRLAPDLAVGNGLKPGWISRDPAIVSAYRGDPLVHDRITPRLGRFILDGGAQVRALAGQWTVPTLLLYAGSDRCVAPAGSAAFAAAATHGAVTAHAFGPLFHEIFNEPEQAEVYAVLREWLASRFAFLPKF